MSIEHISRLRCDFQRCETVLERPGPGYLARQYASRHQWSIGRSDFCPDHNARGKRIVVAEPERIEGAWRG
jgi:hypothetical protein